MSKYIRKHIKDEKRILKLMYKKDIFKLLKIDFNKCAWEYLTLGKKLRRGIKRRVYSGHVYLPQLHSYSCDYWGEWDSFSVINSFQDYLMWQLSKDFDDNGFPINAKYLNNKEMIKYLSKLKTVVNNGKFNKMLKRNSY